MYLWCQAKSPVNSLLFADDVEYLLHHLYTPEFRQKRIVFRLVINTLKLFTIYSKY